MEKFNKENLARTIENKIGSIVENAPTVTRYRKPLVGFASAKDPLFTEMKEIIGPHHLHPLEMLPEGKTVISFFLPFAKEIVKAQRAQTQVAREWAVAYIETNELIAEISSALIKELTAQNFKAVTQKATHNFNPTDLTAAWSHKSAAYVAGLGTFGLHHMLITPSGCSGRTGSVVTSAEIPASPRPSGEFCLYYKTGKCSFCVDHCPTAALTEHGLDKQKCYRQLLEVDASFPDLGLCDVCGKCAVGPCALTSL